MSTQVSMDAAPMLVFPGMGQTQARKRTIASVHYMQLGPFKFHHKPFYVDGKMVNSYFLPPPTRGSVAYLNVYDTQQMVPDTSDHDAPYGSAMTPKPVAVESVVKDILDNSRMGFIGKLAHFLPGIDLVAGDVATPDEIARLMKMEEKFCRAAILEADEIWERRSDPREKRIIGSLHRGALEWMGSEKRMWFQEIERGGFKTGAASGTRIPLEALMDAGTDLVELYVKYELNPLDYGDTHIATLLEGDSPVRRRAQKLLGKAIKNEQ